MKHLRRALSLAALICATLAQANHFDRNNLSLNVGPTFNYARFRFYDETAAVTTSLPNTSGFMAGIHADLTYEHACNLFARLRFDGRWNVGNFDRFNGVVANNTWTGTRYKVRDFRPELDLGYTFAFGDCGNFEFTPYTGVGLIYLQTHRRDVPNVALDLRNPQDRRYNVYIPVGFQFDWARSDVFSVGLNAEYRAGVWGRFQRRTEDVNPTETTNVNLKVAQGFLVEVPLTWAHETCHCYDWQFKVVPYFDWNRWGGRKNDTAAFNDNTVRLRQWYVGLHVDFGVNF